MSAEDVGLGGKRVGAGAAIGTPIISKERAARTALRMIDDDGLAAFSIERLARAIGVRGPSLYKHFRDRDDLLAAVARLVLLEVPAPRRRPGRTWDEQMLDLALALRRAVLVHPHAGPLLLQFLPRQLMIQPYDSLVRSLREAGIDERYHLLILEGLEKVTLGFALYHAASRTWPGSGFPAFDGEEFPDLRGALDASPFDEDQLFVASCRAFLDGVRAMIIADRR
ncbi:MAG TPA: TetR family transcriptional regulator [Pseudonocardia sp.]|nr:TetR family transcriptional regulator [Pseudonocardia sp.]